MTDMLPPKDKLCKFTGFEKKCRELVCSGTCTDNWVNIQGQHPQSGEALNKWGCSSELQYLVTLDAARNANTATAAVLRTHNMIFDPGVRARELSQNPIAIEDKSNADHNHHGRQDGLR